jgi:hypothetical protein
MGDTVYQVENIVVKEGRVEFRLFVGTKHNVPARVSTDILTIDP